MPCRLSVLCTYKLDRNSMQSWRGAVPPTYAPRGRGRMGLGWTLQTDARTVDTHATGDIQTAEVR